MVYIHHLHIQFCIKCHKHFENFKISDKILSNKNLCSNKHEDNLLFPLVVYQTQCMSSKQCYTLQSLSGTAQCQGGVNAHGAE